MEAKICGWEIGAEPFDYDLNYFVTNDVKATEQEINGWRQILKSDKPMNQTD